MVPSEYGNSSVIYRKDLVDESYQDKPDLGAFSTMKNTRAG